VLQEFLTATSGDPDSFARYGHPIFPHFPEIDNPKLDGKPLLYWMGSHFFYHIAAVIWNNLPA
jgi:hypothetical protein